MKVGAIRIDKDLIEVCPEMTSMFIEYLKSSLVDLERHETSRQIVYTGLCEEFGDFDHHCHSDVLTRVYPVYTLVHDKVDSKYWFELQTNQYFCT